MYQLSSKTGYQLKYGTVRLYFWFYYFAFWENMLHMFLLLTETLTNIDIRCPYNMTLLTSANRHPILLIVIYRTNDIMYMLEIWMDMMVNKKNFYFEFSKETE